MTGKKDLLKDLSIFVAVMQPMEEKYAHLTISNDMPLRTLFWLIFAQRIDLIVDEEKANQVFLEKKSTSHTIQFVEDKKR